MKKSSGKYLTVKGKVGESGLNFIDNTAITHTSLRDFTYAGVVVVQI